MKKSIIGLCLILLISFHSVSFAKIITDIDFNDSIAFYFWETHTYPKGMSGGRVWIEPVKYIDAANNEQYWLRIDAMRRDKIMQYGKLIISDKTFSIEQIDNPEGKHRRIGIRARESIRDSWVHAFFSLPADALAAYSQNKDVKIVFSFQSAADATFELTPEEKSQLEQLTKLKRQDVNAYK